MRTVELRGSTGEVLRPEFADNAWTRFRGLLGRRSLAPDSGLLLMRCSSVHMCFMTLTLDVVYLDREFRVIKVVSQLRPWRFSVGGRGARHALELPAGTAARIGLEAGDILGFNGEALAA